MKRIELQTVNHPNEYYYIAQLKMSKINEGNGLLIL